MEANEFLLIIPLRSTRPMNVSFTSSSSHRAIIVSCRHIQFDSLSLSIKEKSSSSFLSVLI